MKPRVLSVTLELDGQKHKDGRFTVPKEICKLMKIDNGDKVIVEIKGEKNLTILASGTEVYGSDFTPLIRAGERIKVTISLP